MLPLADISFFANAITRHALIGLTLLGITAGVVGTFAFLRKRALIGDSISHSVLPGVAAAFMLSQVKHPLILMIGAFISGWLSIIAVDFITNRTRLKPDTAIGMVLSVFFGLGIVLLTHIQASGNAQQAGLEDFLFGSAASMLARDVWTIGITGLLLIAVVFIFFRAFRLLAFDAAFARASGMPVKLLEVLLSTLTVLSVAIGIQAVGVVLMAAMLITPATAARYWTNKLEVMLGLAALFGALSGMAGAWISTTAFNMPTGPWVIVVSSTLALLSILFAPKRGVLANFLTQRRNRIQILDENILKTFYKLGEQNGSFEAFRTHAELKKLRSFSIRGLRWGLRRLTNKNLLVRDGQRWALTEKGANYSKRLVRIHRLWELYLTTYMRIAPDHVHDDAEAIEHVITPEIEHKLEKLLQEPQTDPHSRTIPYQNS